MASRSFDEHVYDASLRSVGHRTCLSEFAPENQLTLHRHFTIGKVCSKLQLNNHAIGASHCGDRLRTLRPSHEEHELAGGQDRQGMDG